MCLARFYGEVRFFAVQEFSSKQDTGPICTHRQVNPPPSNCRWSAFLFDKNDYDTVDILADTVRRADVKPPAHS